MMGEPYPVEGHVTGILKYVVVRMTHDVDVLATRRALWTKREKCMLGMGRTTRYRFLDLKDTQSEAARAFGDGQATDLFIYNDVNLDTGLCSALQHLIETPLLIVVGRTAEEELRRQPPVGNVNGLAGPFQRRGHSPKVVAAIDIPLDLVARPFGSKRLKAVAFGNLGPFFIRCLFVGLVVSVIGILAASISGVDPLHMARPVQRCYQTCQSRASSEST